MKKQKGSIRNTLKNTALVILTILLFALTLVAWDIGVWQGQDQHTILGRLRLWSPLSDSQRTVQNAAAEPAFIAVRTDGELVGAAYQEAGISELYGAVRGLLADAMGQAELFEEASEDELAQVLTQQDTIVCMYNGTLPFNLIAGWAGAERKGQPNLHTSVAVLSKEGALYIRQPEDGVLLKNNVTVSAVRWEDALKTAASGACAYAVEMQGYNNLYPETLIMQEKMSFDILQETIPDLSDAARGETVGEILEAFGYNPYMGGYTDEGERNETDVFVDNYGELRIGRNGTISYRAISTSGGISAYNPSESDKTAQLAAQVEFSHTLLGALTHAAGTGAKASLSAVQYETQTGNCVLTFSQTYSGVMIDTQHAGGFARLEFRDEQLVSAQINLAGYTPTGERLYILPVQQAALAKQEPGMYRFVVRYLDSGDGRMLAQTVLQ